MADVKGNIFTFAGVTDVSDCRTSREVMEKAGLAWRVEKTKVFAEMPAITDMAEIGLKHANQFYNGDSSFKPVDNNFCVYRTDKNIPLGMVNSRYTPVQNIDVFKFFDEAIGQNDVSWFTAGCKGYGNQIFVSAKLSDKILVNGKDPIDNYLVFSTSHDGSKGVRIMVTPIRLICFNVMNTAIKRASNFITIRHTKSVHRKINQAQEILGIARQQIDMFGKMMEQMTKIKFTDDEATELFGNVILSSAELKALANTGHTVKELTRRNWMAMEDANISSQKVNMINDMVTYYYTGAGQREFLGTGYGVYNAVNGYYSNRKNEEGYKRLETLTDGTYSTNIKLASDLILS